MTNFAAISRPVFGQSKSSEPKPFKGRTLARRQAMFKEAAQLMPSLPAREGEATHAIMTGRYDLMVLIALTVKHYGGICRQLRIATLSFNNRNTSEMAELLRSGAVENLTLLCSEFFRDNNKQEFAVAVDNAAGFGERFTLAAARNHCKVVCAEMANGITLVIEGSANLRTNANWEQMAFIRDERLHDWHSAWIDKLVSEHAKAA